MREKKVAVVGGGPSGLFVVKRFIKSNASGWTLHIFEKSDEIGPGMPYSKAGANEEHVTNVSDNETPELVTDVKEWIQHEPEDVLKRFKISADHFNEYKVIPRLLFGRYLADQFRYLRNASKQNEVEIITHYNSEVIDVINKPNLEKIDVITANNQIFTVDFVIMCTGHSWKTKNEGVIANYFDSPYPPSKLNLKLNHAVAIRGASLSAIDAIKTLARNNGTFISESDKLTYHLSDSSKGFQIVMYSINGLPALRFHLEHTSPSQRKLLTDQQVRENRDANDGFLSLDYVFNEKFKRPLEDSDPEFYDEIKDMKLEDFTKYMTLKREGIEAFTLLEAEYDEAERSIKLKESVHWKELLAELSFVMNYPAKHFSAEDMLRLKNVLMPLISVIIAFVPQGSAQEIMALHDAGVLSLITVDDNSRVEPGESGGADYFTNDTEHPITHYKTFVDCVGQNHFTFEDFPFKSLINDETISGARIKFRSPVDGEKYGRDHHMNVESDNGGVYLKVPGIAINDCFQVIDKFGAYNSRIYIMAVPFISGLNPDYSGLDFCEHVSGIVVSSILKLDNTPH